jgi:predicted dehydrogenase
MTIRVGVIGTSWWADSMYLPALTGHPGASVVAVCGRDPERTAEFAQRWEIPLATTDADELLDDGLDAVIVATGNDSHESLTLAALDRGLHVLCEKPLSLTPDSANAMAKRAREVGAITLVPFTYRYMPTNQYLKRLITEGYLGRPFHLNLRYFTGYAREPGYNWRFDTELAGSGVLGDLGSHWLDLARWLFGEITEIGAVTETFYDRPDRPDGTSYVRSEDSAVMTVRFESGAYGTLQTSAVCWEGTAFNQTHHVDAHGSGGTLYSLNDWETVQEVRGLSAGDPGPAPVLSIPDDIWGEARRDRVHDTYKDVFRSSGAMIGDFIDAVRDERPCEPDFQEGARVQHLLALALESASLDGRLLTTER